MARATSPEIDDCVSVDDFKLLAEKKMTRSSAGYFNSGATDEQSMRDNCSAFKDWRFQPKVLRDVSSVDTRSDVLGNELAFPVCIAPSGLNKMANPDGDLGIANAAAALNIGFTLSSGATTSIEEIAQNVPSLLRWFQLYVYKDRNVVRDMVHRAEHNGFNALIVTVDTPVLGKRFLNLRTKFSPPADLAFKNFEGHLMNGVSPNFEPIKGAPFAKFIASMHDPSLTWEDIDWLRTITKLPIIIKGVLSAEMAIECTDHGVAGILVSNHGGRQLDGTISTIDALPQVVKAVNGRCEVYLDGGIRNGGDITKALALGAKAVFIGRPVIWGLTCFGQAGARKVLEILRDEFELTLKLLGVASIEELRADAGLVVHISDVISKL